MLSKCRASIQTIPREVFNHAIEKDAGPPKGYPGPRPRTHSTVSFAPCGGRGDSTGRVLREKSVADVAQRSSSLQDPVEIGLNEPAGPEDPVNPEAGVFQQ